MTRETSSQNAIIVKAFAIGCALWRNNSGVANFADRPVRYGLGNDSAKLNKQWKSGDLVGIMWGGRFLMVECKPVGWIFRGTDREVAQLNAINDVNQRGGAAFFATSADEFERKVRYAAEYPPPY